MVQGSVVQGSEFWLWGLGVPEQERVQARKQQCDGVNSGAEKAPSTQSPWRTAREGAPSEAGGEPASLASMPPWKSHFAPTTAFGGACRPTSGGDSVASGGAPPERTWHLWYFLPLLSRGSRASPCAIPPHLPAGGGAPVGHSFWPAPSPGNGGEEEGPAAVPPAQLSGQETPGGRCQISISISGELGF